MDADTGTVLMEKNADTLTTPASMSKLLTILIIFEKLQDKSLSMEDKFLVSEKAWRKGGTKMFVEVGKKVSIADLLYGIIVQSGNDACIVVAEGIAGSEEVFAEMMTRRAAQIGLKKSTFTNATGWPDPNHLSTMRDLALVAKYIFDNFPEYYHIFSEKEFKYNDIQQYNRNSLLWKNLGVDGLKTGRSKKSGYGIVASAQRNGRRLILVVNGLQSTKERTQQSTILFEWGFRSFENYHVAKKGEVIAEIPVWLGKKQSVPITANDNIILTLPKTKDKKTLVDVVYNSPISAPIKKGMPVATLKIHRFNEVLSQHDLFTAEDVKRLNLFGRLKSVLIYLVLGVM